MRNLLAACETTVRKIGFQTGYVPQQIASSWAAQHASAIAKALLAPAKSHDLKKQLGIDISGLFINTLCIAHQYFIDLAAVYRQGGLPLPFSELLAHKTPYDDSSSEGLGNAITSLTRAAYSQLAFYHGWPVEPPTDSVAGKLVQIQLALYCVCKTHNIALPAILSERLEQDHSLPKVLQHANKYDPVISTVLDNFYKIKQKSVCSFAPKANAWGARPWDANRTLESNLADSVDILARLSRCAPYEKVDAFLIELPGPYSQNVAKLAETVRRVLDFVAHSDPTGEYGLEDVKGKTWRFIFSGVGYFIQSFGECYGNDSSRSNLGNGNTYIQFVSEVAFKRYIPPDAWQSSRDVIRARAEDFGQPYDIPDPFREYLTFVHNSRKGLPFVDWTESHQARGNKEQ